MDWTSACADVTLRKVSFLSLHRAMIVAALAIDSIAGAAFAALMIMLALA